MMTATAPVAAASVPAPIHAGVMATTMMTATGIRPTVMGHMMMTSIGAAMMRVMQTRIGAAGSPEPKPGSAALIPWPARPAGAATTAQDHSNDDAPKNCHERKRCQDDWNDQQEYHTPASTLKSPVG
jgi:hypothetical protein